MDLQWLVTGNAGGVVVQRPKIMDPDTVTRASGSMGFRFSRFIVEDVRLLEFLLRF